MSTVSISFIFGAAAAGAQTPVLKNI